MGFYKFIAYMAKTKEPIKVEIHLAGKNRGYTPGKKDSYLEVETAQNAVYQWFARRHGQVVARGKSAGGSISVIVD